MEVIFISITDILASEFAKTIKPNNRSTNETIVYGTIIKDSESTSVQIDGSETRTPISTTTDVEDRERVTVLIKDHQAIVTGNTSSPSARNGTVQAIDARVVSAEEILAFNNNQIQSLSVEYLKVTETLIANTAKIEKLEGNFISYKEAVFDELEATNARIDKITSTEITTEYLEANYATIENLKATNARIDKIASAEITTEYLEANYATIENLKSTNATVKSLTAITAKIDTLIFGSASGDVIQTQFSNSVIAQLGDAQIKSVMIQDVTASKITAGTIYTDDVTIQSKNGQMILSDNTIQISDSTRVRVQIGKDASGDYSINVWDKSGNLMFSQGGITDKAIKSAIIRNDMVSENANIHAGKLDISSLFTEINKSSNTIKATKVYLDEEKQTLEASFKSMNTTITDINDQMIVDNLIPYPYYDTTHTDNAITFTDKGDGTIGVSTGTATANCFFVFRHAISSDTVHLTLSKGTYTISGGTENIRIRIYKVEKNATTTQLANDYGKGSTFTLEEDTRISVQLYIPSGTSVTATTIKPMLEKGTVFHPYQPYELSRTGLKETITSQGTQLEVLNGQISSKIWEQDITTAVAAVNGKVSNLSTKYSTLEQDVSGFKTAVSTTYSTKTEVKNLETIATQTANKFNWLVKSGTSETNFTLTDRTIELVAENIKVDGDMIVDGTITTKELNVNNIFGDTAVLNKIVSQDIFSNAIATNSIVVGKADIDDIMADNLIPYPYEKGENSHVDNGIVWSINNDGTVKANGTATARSSFVIAYSSTGGIPLEKGTYTLSGCPKGGSTATYCIVANFIKNNSYVARAGIDVGNGCTFSITDEHDGIAMELVVLANTTASNLTFKPMLEKGTVIHPYQPYNLSRNGITKQIKQIIADNLLTYPYYDTTHTDNAITFTDKGDGTIGVSTGTATANCFFVFRHAISGDTVHLTLSKGTYTISGGTEKIILRAYKVENNATTTQLANDNGNSATFTITEDTRISVQLYIPSGTSVTTATTIKPMLEVGTVAHPYQPYALSKQGLIGQMVVDNLLIYPYVQTTKTTQGITYTDIGDGTVKVSGTPTYSNNYVIRSRKSTDDSNQLILSAGTYILSGCPKGGELSTYYLQCGTTNDADGNWLSLGNDYGDGVTFTLTKETVIQVLIVVDSHCPATNVIFKPMLEKGTVAHSYVEYSKSGTGIAKNLYYGNTTYIDGGKIYTGSVTADKINVADLFAQDIVATGSITSPILKSSDYKYSSGDYSSAGMLVDLKNKLIRTPKVAIKPNGSIVAKDGTFTGTVNASEGKIGNITIQKDQGIYYSPTTDLGFGLWATTAHANIAFHAGANNNNIGGAPFRIYHNGDVVAKNIDVQGGKIGYWSVDANGVLAGTSGEMRMELYPKGKNYNISSSTSATFFLVIYESGGAVPIGGITRSGWKNIT